MKYLITGSAGFIGFHLANELVKNEKNTVYGIDNFDDYYSVKLKKARIKLLRKKKNFNFIKINIANKNEINKLLAIKVDIIFHLAAQAGVRYTLVNPVKYINTNVIGYYNLLTYIKNSSAKCVFYASSSSVYGDAKKFPVDENIYCNPKNIYAFSKLLNENCSKLFSKIFKVKFIGLRFFTVYGEWGRPDMLIYKFLNSAKKNKTFIINNYGKDCRDFTYVGDVISILMKLIEKRNKLKSHEIFNISSNKPIQTEYIINKLSINYSGKKKYVGANKVEILKTHGNNKKVIRFTKFKKFSDFNEKLILCINWFKKNNHLF